MVTDLPCIYMTVLNILHYWITRAPIYRKANARKGTIAYFSVREFFFEVLTLSTQIVFIVQFKL